MSIYNPAHQAWIRQNMPELDARLGPMSKDDVRKTLCEVTGLDVYSHESVSDSMERFMARLKEMKQ